MNAAIRLEKGPTTGLILGSLSLLLFWALPFSPLLCMAALRLNEPGTAGARMAKAGALLCIIEVIGMALILAKMGLMVSQGIVY